jgi:hypothetical protein
MQRDLAKLISAFWQRLVANTLELVVILCSAFYIEINIKNALIPSAHVRLYICRLMSD